MALIYKVLSLLALLAGRATMTFAWQNLGTYQTQAISETAAGTPFSPASISPVSSSSSRRNFLSQLTTAAIIASTTTLLPPQACLAAAAISPDAAKDQWKQAMKTMDNLLQNWSTIAPGGGDAIRTQLGTQGTTSPLFQIDKVLKVLREEADNFIEFQETAEEFLLALSRADSMAYSANFAGGSGKPTPPAVYIEKSKVEVQEMQKIAKTLNSLL